MMFDLCQLYGRENYRIVERIIHLAIQLQPMYNDDLKETFDFLTKVRCIFIYIFCSLTEAAMFSWKFFFRDISVRVLRIV